MKKIISTLALATLAFGSVFADVTFTTNYRTRMAAFSRVMNADDWAATAKADRFNSYLFAQRGYDSASDDFKIEVANDFGGAGVRIDPSLGGNQDTSDDRSALAEYYGYVNLGAIKITAGLIDGISNGTYRLTDEVGASNLCGESTDAYAPGSMHGAAISFKADDITYFDGEKRPVGMITYTGDFGDTVLTADLVAAAIDNNNGSATWDGSEMHAALGARVDLKIPAADIQFVFKQHTNTNAVSKRSVALHVAPAISENLSLALGGAAGFYNGDLSEFNADIRFMFKSGNMSITSLNTIGFVTDNGVSNGTSVGYDTHVGLVFVDSTGASASQDNRASQSSMWNLLAFRMEASEKLAVFCNIGDIIGFNAAHKEIGDYGMEFFLAPGFQFYATKNCSITSALRVGVSNLLMDDDTYTDIEPAYGILVPVVLRVQL